MSPPEPHCSSRREGLLAPGTAQAADASWNEPRSANGWDVLAELQGVVRWGGDTESPEESAFFIEVPPGSAKLALVAETLGQWSITPGKGAWTQNIEDPKRIRAAKKLAGMQAA